jgi:hypothetical protein
MLAPEDLPVPVAESKPEEAPVPMKPPAPEALESTKITDGGLEPKPKSKLPVLLIGCGGLALVTVCVLVVVFIVSGVGVFQDLLGDLSFLPGSPGIIDYSLEEVLAEDFSYHDGGRTCSGGNLALFRLPDAGGFC